jgi:hypothetical protein
MSMDPYPTPSKTPAAYDADTLMESPHLWDVASTLMIPPIHGDIWSDEEYSYHGSLSEDEDEDQDKEQLANEDQEKELAELKARATLNVPLAVLSPTLALALQEVNEHASLDLGRHLTSRVKQETGLTRAQHAEKQIAKTRPSAREYAVKTVYSYMLRKNKDLRVDNSGGSTYGEIPQKGIQDICDTMKELKIITDDKKCVVADLGAGFMLPCLHIAQEFSTCSVVGIENDPVRCLGFASSFEKLLEDDSQPLVNYKIVLIHRDLFSIHDFEFVDVVYAFDEAFPSELNRHIYTVFGKSKRPKWLIVFKVGLPGMREEIKELETLAGVEFVKKNPKLHKSVSGGSSTVCFFQRKIPVTPATTGLCPQSQLQPSWHDDKQALLSAVQSLHRSLVNALPSGKRISRTVKRRRVVFLAVE